MKEKELRLDYCDECMQMTNHLDDECQKCKAREKKKINLNIDLEEDEEFKNY